MPKVSVLMPIWNTREDHLREAMESILNQTFSDFEYLILNDSPDNTKLDEIVASYNDPRIRYARNEKNVGITPSRNKLLQMAEGEYIAIFDHDDISEPTRLEKQVAYLEAHPEVGVVGSLAMIHPSGQLTRYPEDDLSIKEMLMDVCPMLHPASMLRKSVLDTHHISYEEEYTPAEDYRLWLRLIPHTKFHNIQEVLFKYRDHASNTSHQQKDRMHDATIRLHAYAKAKYPDLYAIYNAEKPDIWSIKLLNLIPIITIFFQERKVTVKLFGIPFLTMRKKGKLHPKVAKLVGKA